MFVTNSRDIHLTGKDYQTFMFIYFGELQASCSLPLDVAFVVIGIVHDRVPRNNQRGNFAPDELGSFGARSPHAARSFERVPAAPRAARAVRRCPERDILG